MVARCDAAEDDSAAGGVCRSRDVVRGAVVSADNSPLGFTIEETELASRPAQLAAESSPVEDETPRERAAWEAALASGATVPHAEAVAKIEALRAAEERCCVAAMALAAARGDVGEVLTTLGRVAVGVVAVEQCREACAAGSALARLRGGT